MKNNTETISDTSFFSFPHMPHISSLLGFALGIGSYHRSRFASRSRVATDQRMDRQTPTLQLPVFLLPLCWQCCAALPYIKCVDGRGFASCQGLDSFIDGWVPIWPQKMETDRPLTGEIRYLCFGAIPRKGTLHVLPEAGA